MASRFESQLSGFGIKALDVVDKVRRSSVLELFRLVIFATPVDTGLLRGNWQTTINVPATSKVDRLDTTGDQAMAEAMANMGGLLDVVWFSNALPYAEKIELDGGLNRRGQAMVRKHIAMWRRIVAAKAKAFSGGASV